MSQTIGRASNNQLIYSMNNVVAKPSRTVAWHSLMLVLVCEGWVPMKTKVSDCCLDLQSVSVPILQELLLLRLSSAKDPSAKKLSRD